MFEVLFVNNEYFSIIIKDYLITGRMLKDFSVDIMGKNCFDVVKTVQMNWAPFIISEGWVMDIGLGFTPT